MKQSEIHTAVTQSLETGPIGQELHHPAPVAHLEGALGGSSAPLRLREAPAGLPDPGLVPPTVAETGDPFAGLRVLHLLARIPRGRPVRLADVADRLNATYLDWLFPVPVVAGVALQLRANWLADYRTVAGIEVEDGERGPTIRIEDSPRVDPWIVRQVEREAAACRRRLLEFSNRDRETGDG